MKRLLLILPLFILLCSAFIFSTHVKPKIHIGQSLKSFTKYAYVRLDHEGEVNDSYKDYIGSFKKTTYNGANVECTFIDDKLECLLFNKIFYTKNKLDQAIMQHKTLADFFIKDENDLKELIKYNKKEYYDNGVTTKIEIIENKYYSDYRLDISVYSDKYQTEFKKLIEFYKKL